MNATHKPIISAGLIAVSVASLTWLYFSFRAPPPPRLDSSLMLAAGEVAADEVTKLTGGAGQIVVLVAEVPEIAKPQLDALLDKFTQTLRRQPGLELTATETIRFDPPGIAERGIPAATYFALLAKHATARAFVSFAGAPALAAGDWERLPTKRPRLLCFTSNLEPLVSLIQQGVVQTAIIPGLTPAHASGKKNLTNRDRFDQAYLIVTADNAAAVLGPIDQKR